MEEATVFAFSTKEEALASWVGVVRTPFTLPKGEATNEFAVPRRVRKKTAPVETRFMIIYTMIK